MKIKEVSPDGTVFIPVTIQVTIENIDDAMAWFEVVKKMQSKYSQGFYDILCDKYGAENLRSK